MFSRKLKALGHHNCDSFNPNDEKQFRNGIVWLEDKKIRNYKIEEREPLRRTKDPSWKSALKKYLCDLHAPVDFNDNTAILEWLLSYAVRLHYKQTVIEQAVNQPIAKTNSKSDNPDALCNITAENETLKAGIRSLANALSVPLQDDHTATLEVLKILIEERLNPTVATNYVKQETGKQEKTDDSSRSQSLNDVSLGFDVNDNLINDAAKVVRLLHIKELRDVQTKVNQAIVAVQKLTANPITDQSLGKVGR